MLARKRREGRKDAESWFKVNSWRKQERGRKDHEDEVGKVMGTGWTGKEREKFIVSRQTIEKSQHKIELQSIRL